MDNLERCECEGWVGRWPYHGRNDPPDTFRCSDCDRIIEERFVPESQLRGAVSAIERAPDRIWTNAHAGSILTGSERMADEMRALGDTLVGYVRADLHQGAVEALDKAWADYAHKATAGYPSVNSARERLREVRERHRLGGQSK